MNPLLTDTIAALATAPGRSSVAMFRVSGPEAFTVCDRILEHRRPTANYAARTIHRAVVHDSRGEAVDDVLVAVFHEPSSYTGEDVVEITCHGGAVPIRRLMSLLLAGGARRADPGEFTLRAFLGGKLDLAQAEAVCDLIDARSDEGFRLAQAQQLGALSQSAGALREKLIGITVRIEATIDFPEDVGAFPEGWCVEELKSVSEGLDRLIASAGRGMLYRDGIGVVLTGRPNSGKSSLLNALLRADRAIVTAVPGTTRDLIEESLSIRGIPVRLTDTAGLRESSDEIERLGIERTRQSVRTADIVLHVHDASAERASAAQDLGIATPGVHVLTVWNKIDLVPSLVGSLPGISVSALTGEGIEGLEERIADAALDVAGVCEAGSEGAVVTHARHKQALVDARASVERAFGILEKAEPLDFLSIEVRSALDSIGLITGESAPQSIIDEIFHRFCIGK